MANTQGTLLTLVILTLGHTGVKATCSSLFNPWTNPCAGSTVSRHAISSIHLSSTPRPLKPLLDSLVTELLSARNKAEKLKLKYIAERYTHVSPLTREKLRGFPVQTWPVEQNISVTNQLLRDYRKLSTVAVFLNQTICDEEQPSYVRLLMSLENSIYSILCKMQMALGTFEEQVTSHVSQSVMSERYRNFPTRAIKEARDFVVVRDTERLFGTLSEQYTLLSQAQTR